MIAPEVEHLIQRIVAGWIRGNAPTGVSTHALALRTQDPLTARGLRSPVVVRGGVAAHAAGADFVVALRRLLDPASLPRPDAAVLAGSAAAGDPVGWGPRVLRGFVDDGEPRDNGEFRLLSTRRARDDLGVHAVGLDPPLPTLAAAGSKVVRHLASQSISERAYDRRCSARYSTCASGDNASNLSCAFRRSSPSLGSGRSEVLIRCAMTIGPSASSGA